MQCLYHILKELKLTIEYLERYKTKTWFHNFLHILPKYSLLSSSFFTTQYQLHFFPSCHVYTLKLILNRSNRFVSCAISPLAFLFISQSYIKCSSKLSSKRDVSKYFHWLAPIRGALVLIACVMYAMWMGESPMTDRWPNLWPDWGESPITRPVTKPVTKPVTRWGESPW